MSKIPSGYTGTVNFFWSTQGSYVTTFCGSGLDTCEDYIKLASIEVDVVFDAEAAVPHAITALQKQIKAVQAEAERNVNNLQGQINSLLSIEHQPTPADKEPSDD